MFDKAKQLQTPIITVQVIYPRDQNNI